MFRSLLQTAGAAWTTAVLLVAPVLAAIECRNCCGAAPLTEPEAACCAAGGMSCCCGAPQDTTANEQPKGGKSERCPSCPTCPKCEAKRPIPAATSGSSIWKPSLEVIAATAIVVDEQLPHASGTWSLTQTHRDRTGPALRVLYCTWQE